VEKRKWAISAIVSEHLFHEFNGCVTDVAYDLKAHQSLENSFIPFSEPVFGRQFHELVCFQSDGIAD
jgi:hypothetical protein